MDALKYCLWLYICTLRENYKQALHGMNNARPLTENVHVMWKVKLSRLIITNYCVTVSVLDFVILEQCFVCFRLLKLHLRRMFLRDILSVIGRYYCEILILK